MAKSLDARLEDAEQRVAIAAPAVQALGREEMRARLKAALDNLEQDKNAYDSADTAGKLDIIRRKLAEKREELDQLGVNGDPLRRSRLLEFRVHRLELDALELEETVSLEVIWVAIDRLWDALQCGKSWPEALPTHEQALELIKRGVVSEWTRPKNLPVDTEGEPDAPIGQLVPAIAGPGPHRDPPPRDPMRPFSGKVGRLDEYEDKLAPYRDRDAPYFEPGAV